VPGVAASGQVSGGILPYPPDVSGPFPGARPPGTQGETSSSTPGWFADRPSDEVDYDAPSDPATPSRPRPWSSGPRPSDVGFTEAFYPSQSGQIVPGVPDSTGTSGIHRLRSDDGAPGVMP
jgi:hypothetical protein